MSEMEAERDEALAMLRLSWSVCIDGSVEYSAMRPGAPARLVFETDDRSRIRDGDQWIDYLRRRITAEKVTP